MVPVELGQVQPETLLPRLPLGALFGSRTAPADDGGGPMTAEPVLPPGCRCDPTEWLRGINIPAACDRYAPPPDDVDSCVDCEHLKACHAKSKPTNEENENG